MELMVDTNIFIRFEKSGKPIDFVGEFAKGLHRAVIVSELLMGVHRANTEERRRRGQPSSRPSFPESGCWTLPSRSAPVHAEIHAELAKKGQIIGAHDLIIAATARCHGLSVLTDNVLEFSASCRTAPVIPFAT